MKKILAICMGLLATANLAFANDTEKINHLSTDEASKICGEKFSTEYFNDQYEKLALLKRCELSLKTVPLPIWNLDKYVENKIEIPYSELGINKLEDVKSFLAVEKIGKHNVITVSHLYKQNKKLYALNTSLLSEKDQLYILSTYDVDDNVLAPKEDEKLEDVPEIIKRMHAKEEEKIVNVIPKELEAEVRKNIWDEHVKFVKKFKASKIKVASETKEDATKEAPEIKEK